MSVFKNMATAAAVAGAFAVTGVAHADETLDAVMEKGSIQCGVSQGLPGFSNPDDAGEWTGLDVDFCRAMAAAIFNDPEAVKFTPLSAKVRFTALTSGEIDVLSRNTTWTMSRDSDFGEFVGVNYYDGQGFMVPTSLGPEIISKEPLGPLVRHGDAQWGDIARWTLACMINAEEAGIDSSNVAEMMESTDPNIQRILGADGDLGSKIGLDNGFCANVITAVGNYGESYDRNVGPDTQLALERGLNALWSDGGVLYAPPMR